MKTIRVLIADDEPLAREGIAVLLRDDPLFEVISMCGDGLSAIQQIRALKPQMAFLDIQMPRLSGLEVYAQLAPTERPAVVFVTAYNEHAVRAFEMCAVDYIVKPFTNQRFNAAVLRACGEILRGNLDDMQRRADELLQKLQVLDGKLAEKSESSERLALRSGNEYLFLDPADVLWIEVTDDLVNIRASGQSHAVRMTLTAIEQLLDRTVFVRVHRSFIVNRRRIKKVGTSMYGDHEIVMEDGRRLRMSRTYRDRLKLLLSPLPSEG